MTCNLKTHTGTARTVDARHHSDAGSDLYAMKMICWTYGYRKIEIEKAREGRFLPTRSLVCGGRVYIPNVECLWRYA